MLLLMVGFALNTYATNPISPEAVDFEKTIKVEKKANKWAQRLAKFSQTKAGKWFVKKATQLTKFMNKVGIDLNDPVEKWLWYAIIGVVAGTIMYVLAAAAFWPLSYIAWLVYLAGVISFWYWVYLKFLQ